MTINKKIAVLINNPSNMEYLQSKFPNNSTIIARNHITKHKTGSKTISYFKIINDDYGKNYNIVVHMSLHWFRDQYGNDLSFNKGISIGNIIARRLLSAFANDYRNYYIIKNLLSNYNLIFASSNESDSFKRISDMFRDRIKWYTPSIAEDITFISPDPERTLFFNFPRVHPLSPIARSIQKPFISILKKRPILNITDWSSIEIIKKRNDTLFLNSLLPWTGYYYNLNKEYLLEANQIFIDEIDTEVLNPDHIKYRLEKILNGIDEELLKYFCKLVQLEYKNGIEIFKRAYALFKEAFNYYTPKLIVIPGETHFAYVIAAQLARKMEIKTALVVDGCQLIVDNSLFYKDQKNENFIFDKFVAFGQTHKDLLVSSGINEKNCILCFPPVLNNHKKSNQQLKYDCIIMAYYPVQLNPDSRWDKRGNSIIDIILILLGLGYKKIALKIKLGHLSDEHYYYRSILEMNDIVDKIEFITGHLYEHIGETNLAIGDISTAAIEFTYHNIPYYIYEPFENGVTDDMINSTPLFNRKSISRTPTELENNLANHFPSIISNYDKMFDGTSLSKIKYSEFIDD